MGHGGRDPCQPARDLLYFGSLVPSSAASVRKPAAGDRGHVLRNWRLGGSLAGAAAPVHAAVYGGLFLHPRAREGRPNAASVVPAGAYASVDQLARWFLCRADPDRRL